MASHSANQDAMFHGDIVGNWGCGAIRELFPINSKKEEELFLRIIKQMKVMVTDMYGVQFAGVTLIEKAIDSFKERQKVKE